ncbi:MAG: endonuclease III domain-containing protein [Actinomycetota bacterium]
MKSGYGQDKERAARVVRLLAREYPKGHRARPDTSAVAERVRDPLDELIFTLLSQHTSDLNRDRAWVSLRHTFKTWSSVAKASNKQIADSIRMGGLADSKAPRIKSVLAEVKEREGRYSLATLSSMTDAEVAEYLTSLHGIGPKTAACVLAFSLGRPALPVDTHVHRIAMRLGFVQRNATAEATQRVLEALVPPRQRVQTHVRLIAHGRTTCTAQRPRCDECILRDLCPRIGVR